MTGPEHYRAAERLIEDAAAEEYGSDRERYALAAAEVHATLALAAATALQPAEYDVNSPEWSDWSKAAGHHEETS